MIELDLGQVQAAIKEQVNKRVQEELLGIDVSQMTDSLLKSIMAEKIDATMNGMINKLLNQGDLLAVLKVKLDKILQDKLDDAVRIRLAGMVSNVDLGTEISKQIAAYVDLRMASSDLPQGLIPADAIDWDGFSISGDMMSGGTMTGFSSTGMQDLASSTELTVMDGMVVVESNLVADQISVNSASEFKSSLNVAGDLRVGGNLVILNPSFNQQVTALINDRLSTERDRLIDIGSNAILADGKELLTANALGPSIALSNLRKVGNLQDLNVIGEMTAADTLHVIDGMVGINTDAPVGALTIWDEDAELTVRKHKSKTTYIGTTRDCDLVIGTVGNPALAIRRDGTVGVNVLEIGSVGISISDKIPEHQGRQGELVIMSNPKADQPWAYQCLGGNTWAALKR